MTSNAFRALSRICACVAGISLLSSGVAVAGAYNPCQVPPVVSSAARPNAMIVMDFSGSMQFPAYFGKWDDSFGGYYSSKVAYQSTYYWQNDTATYDPSFLYYGPFDSDTYYVYDTTGNFFKTADTQPVKSYTGTAETEDGSNGTLWLMLKDTDGNPPSDLQVGDIVAVYDLASNKSLNGDGHKILEVSGNRVRIDPNYEDLPTHEKRDPAWTWNGKADAAGYKAIKRITGDINSTGGVSGNVLNLAVTSRTDAALQALIGGKATTVSGDSTNVYIQAQGARRYVTESTNVNAAFYVRPATLDSSAYYPDDYSSGSYGTKDTFVTITGQYSGKIDDKDPDITSHTEPWKFTLTGKAHVIIKIKANWNSDKGCWVAIYTASNLTGTAVAESKVDNTTTTTLEKDLDAGTYYVRVGPKDDFSGSAAYGLWSDVALEKYTGLHDSASDHQGVALTKIGAIPWARVRIQMTAEQRAKTGLIQQSFSYVRFGFMYYNSDNKGRILVGCHNTDIDTLIDAIQGVVPYNGTPTGEALEEAYDYFKQDNAHTNNYSNTGFIDPGTDKDPYYGTGSSGTVAVPCRKSFVVLISDGNWNGSVDPVKPAREIHVGVVGGDTGDLRTDTNLSGNQTVDVYSIFAFSDSEQGDNAMKAVGMYGSFEDATGCGNDTWPYPTSGYPASSLTFTWPVAQCNKDATACNPPGSCSSTPYYNVTCCKEWNSEWDRDNDGIDENKGSPDSYYKASNGKQLQAALAAVFADVTSRHASASAVATVSQELSEGDLIVRGVFEAADPDKVDSYLWRGHLEAYTPFTYNNEKIYSFELADNQGLLCMDMDESQRHCFDAGYILTTTTDLAAWKVFTFDPDAKTQQDFDTSNTWLTNSIDGSADGVNRLGYLATSQSANTQNLINWVRGSYDASWNLRDRSGWDTAGTKPWRLGDVVYSTPVVVGPPGLGEVSLRDPDIKKFYTHRNNNIHRMKVVYVGANDGMLHAVVLGKYDEANDKWIYDPADDGDGEIGKELWAYIPSNLLTELRPESDGTGGLANTDYGQGGCVHRTTVDLSPRSWEAYINPTANRPDLSDNPCGDEADSNGRCWRTVLVGGERGGGDVYFAIDVTDPRNPIVLWEYAVLKNRVVVEVAASSGDTTCIDECKADCASTSNDCRTDKNTCYNTCPQCERKWDRRWGWYNDCTARDSCRGECDTTYNTCLAECEDKCTEKCTQYIPGAKYFVPFRNAYDSVKILPLSWSQPYLGRIQFPTSLKFYYGDPTPLDMVNGGLPDSAKVDQFDDDGSDSPNNRRAVVIMGGGIHLYDREFDTTPTVEDRFKLALFWPFILMMDIETGHNLFEYVWPIVVRNAADNFPLKVAGDNTIPYAMSDPLALDLWNRNTYSVGDDGFLDRIYVGDMNGYIYGIKLNFESKKTDTDGTVVDNSDFGMQVDLWPTKPIETAYLSTNHYRSDRQPITLAIAATMKKYSNDTLRVLIGAGKYDDMEGDQNDKTDTALMSLYNLEDTIGLPDLSGSDQVYQVYDTTFKVRFNPRCSDVTFDDSSTRKCTWAKSVSDSESAENSTSTICTDPTDLSTCTTQSVASSRDCCEKGNDTCSDPCYGCVYDFTLPGDSALPGERVVGKPLIAGGLVFLTTFVPPNDPCGWTGEGYLYAFGADCVPLSDPSSVFNGAGTAVGAAGSSGSDTAASGVRLSLGSGVPSRPVLDSRGEHIIIQMSDGALKRQEVTLSAKPVQPKGWRSR